jgi:hypothetical protein
MVTEKKGNAFSFQAPNFNGNDGANGGVAGHLPLGSY